MHVHSRLKCLASLIDPVRLLYQTYYFLPFITNKWRNTDEMWLVMGGGLAGSSNSIAVKVPLWLSLTRRVRVDTHWPGLRAVNTSVQHDACVHGPNSRVVCSDTRRRCSRLARLAVDGGVDVDGVTDLSQHCRYRANAVLRRHHRRDDTAQRLLHLALHAIHTHTQQCCRQAGSCISRTGRQAGFCISPSIMRKCLTSSARATSFSLHCWCRSCSRASHSFWLRWIASRCTAPLHTTASSSITQLAISSNQIHLQTIKLIYLSTH